jgi:hypothetical protein
MNQSAQSRAATRCQQTAATGCEGREGQVAESEGVVEIQRTLAITHNEEPQTPCVPNSLTFQRRQLRPEVDGGGGSRPGEARPQADADLAGYAADIDRAIARDMEAAGVEPASESTSSWDSTCVSAS